MSTKKSMPINVGNVLDAFGLKWDYCEGCRYFVVEVSGSVKIDGESAAEGFRAVEAEMLEGSIEEAMENTLVSKVFKQANNTGHLHGLRDKPINDAGVYLVACIELLSMILGGEVKVNQDGSYSLKQDLH